MMTDHTMLNFDWILFDADNTLYDFHASSEIAFHKSFQHHGVHADHQAYSRFCEINEETWKAFDENRMTHEEIKTVRFSTLFKEMGISDMDPLEFNALYFRQLVLNPKFVDGARDILDTLHGQLRLALITNGMKEVQRPRLESSGLLPLFDVVVISGEIGHSKPNEAFFDYAHRQMERPGKHRVLVVGDNIHADIWGAMEYGYKAAWFNPASTLQQNGVVPDHEIRKLEELLTIIGIQ